jgi:outer membrane protein assembly factor BamB
MSADRKIKISMMSLMAVLMMVMAACSKQPSTPTVSPTSDQSNLQATQNAVMKATLMVSLEQTKTAANNQAENPTQTPVSNAADSRIVALFLPDSKNTFGYNSPTIDHDFLYIGTSYGIDAGKIDPDYLKTWPMNYFYKFDLDLKPVWSYELDPTTMVDGGASLDSQGNIYFVTETFSIPTPDELNKPDVKVTFKTAHDLVSLTNDGKFRWSKPISAADEMLIHGMINCAISKDDTIYVGDAKLFAFDTDGNVKWQYPDGSASFVAARTSPIIDQTGSVYFESPEPNAQGSETDQIYLYKFDPASGSKPVWKTLLANNILDPEGGYTVGGGTKERWVLSTPSFSKDQTGVIAVIGNTINRVDAAKGTVVWSIKPDGATGSIKASPAVDENDVVYVGTKSNKESIFYAIKPDGSGILWKIPVGADLYASPFLGDDGKVYFGSENLQIGELHAADTKTGDMLWNLGGPDMPDLSFGSPILYKGYVYFGVESIKSIPGTLFKVKVDASGYLPGAAWPRFHGGNNNDGMLDADPG